MKKINIITPLYLLTILNSAYSQGGMPQELREMFAGYWINFENQKNCTASFVVNKQGVNGLLTSAQCCVNNNCLNGNAFDTAYENEDDGSVTRIGQVHDAQFGGANGLDYAFVSLDSVDWKPFLYTAGLTANDTINNGTITELYPVTSDFTPTEPGLAVCASGQGSGYNCGNLTELDLTLAVSNPWNGKPTILKGLNKVDLGVNSFESKEDIGGPVYAQSNNSGTVTAQGLGHIVAVNNDDPQHKFLYYLPMDKVLNSGDTKLLTHTLEEEKNEIEIKTVKWNETADINGNPTKRATDPEENFYVLAGDKITLGEPDNFIYCTTNFAVKKNGHWNGMMTAGHCVNEEKEDVYWAGNERSKISKKIGYIGESEWKDGNDYAFIDTGEPKVVPVPCVFALRKGWIWDSVDYLPVVTYISSPVIIGREVCASGATSGEVCGKVTNHGLTIRVNYFDQKTNKRGSSMVTGVSLVSTGILPGLGIKGGDSGGPVYIRLDSEGVWESDYVAEAVGHVVAAHFGISGFFPIFYYMPLTKTFNAFGPNHFTLITSDTCPIKSTQKRAQNDQMEQKQEEALIEVPTKK